MPTHKRSHQENAPRFDDMSIILTPNRTMGDTPARRSESGRGSHKGGNNKDLLHHGCCVRLTNDMCFNVGNGWKPPALRVLVLAHCGNVLARTDERTSATSIVVFPVDFVPIKAHLRNT